jgi:hypothetical protein
VFEGELPYVDLRKLPYMHMCNAIHIVYIYIYIILYICIVIRLLLISKRYCMFHNLFDMLSFLGTSCSILLIHMGNLGPGPGPRVRGSVGQARRGEAAGRGKCDLVTCNP